MGLGVLEDDKLEHVPGTAILHRSGVQGLIDATTGLDVIDVTAMKVDKDVVLVPQPSDSPHDPLNWSTGKKELFTAAFAFAVGCVGATGPLLSVATVPLSKQFDSSIPNFVHHYNTVLLGIVAANSIISNCLAVKYGKRPVLLINTVFLIIAQFWGGGVNSLASLSGSRVFAGLGIGPWEALVPACIADVWFVHQRGFRVGVFQLGVIGGINLVLPITGAIVDRWGWRVCNYGMGGAFVLAFLMVFFWMPESSYHRNPALNIDTASHIDLPTHTDKAPPHHLESIESREESRERPRSGTFPSGRELLPWSGKSYDPDSVFAIGLRPFKMLRSPIVLWGAIMHGTCIGWLIMIGVTISQIFSAPPYNFTVTQVGLANLAAFVASVLGALIAHPLSDGVAVYMAKRNGGVYEPEFRLPLVATYACFTAVGFLAWGKAAHTHAPWPIPVIFGLGFINFGIQLTGTGVGSYVVDCHRDHSSESFAMLGWFKGVFGMTLTLYMNDWIVTAGVGNVFYTLGGITIGLTLTTIPLYIWGKRLRSGYHRHFGHHGAPSKSETTPGRACPDPSDRVAMEESKAGHSL